jgi:hypothetical protein
VSRRRLLTAALVMALVPASTLGVTGCGGGKHQQTMVEPDEVYVAIIRWELARLGDATASSVVATEPTDLPIVYVVAADGSAISAKVQANVAAATVDVATVRFADSRDEVLETDQENQPVKDGGVLLSVEPIEPDAARRRITEVVVYRSVVDEQTMMLTVDANGDGATITASTLQPT